MTRGTRAVLFIGGAAALAVGFWSAQPQPRRAASSQDAAPLVAVRPPAEPPRTSRSLPAPAAEPGPPAAERQRGGDYGMQAEQLPALAGYRSAPAAADREDALFELALSDDPQVLPFLLDELTKAGPAEHATVLQAVIQYASRDAVPTLRALAARSEDPQRRKALDDAADFLELPSLTELRTGVRVPPRTARVPEPDADSDVD
jgi:hypothetical protein